MVRGKLFFLLLFAVLLVPVKSSRGDEAASPLWMKIFLVPQGMGPGNPFFDEVCRAGKEGKASDFEKAKIDFLLAAVRMSTASFLRGGRIYSGNEAARHLEKKYARSGKRIRSAREFIDKIASYSFMTGEPYLLKLPGYEKCPVKIVLSNELQRLESRIEVIVN